MIFERKLEDNLFELRDELLSGRYQHSPYEPFTIHDPKQRTIHKAMVRDRVVHQALVNVMESRFERRFIYDSYSCRREKGTHAAVNRLQTFLWKSSANNTITQYALKCDIRKFFASVDHGILISLLKKQICDDRVMHLLKQTIDSFCTLPGLGIPLGNLTSQLFANVYLHELDWYIKQKLRVKHYVRYCDDFVILVKSKEQARDLVEKIQGFLHENLRLDLHPNKIHIKTWTQGIDFLGYVLLSHATLLRSSTAKRMVRRIDSENLPSYLGLCMHADAHELACLIRHKAHCLPK